VRQVLLLVLAVLAFAVRASAQETSDKEKIGLKGPVKSVRTKTLMPTQSGPGVEAQLFDSENAFDREGRSVEKKYYETDGRLWRREVFTYDADGCTQVAYDREGKIQSRVLTRKEEFDKERRTGRKVVTDEGYGGTLYAEFVRKYDERGRWLETSVYDRGGKLQTRSVNRFGADGRLQEFVHYNGAGTVLHRYVTVPEGQQVYTYDSGGALFSTVTQRRMVCKESDPYGNCVSESAVWTVSKGGRVAEVNVSTTRSLVYY
jgi:hypothetical protein